MKRSLALSVLALCAAAHAAAPDKPYRILVTNDDGVRAPGILALAQALKSIGEVTVIAPAENQSAKGHSLTRHDPIYIEHVALSGGGILAVSLAATPASCVKVALLVVLPVKPDLVVSGINKGYNLGCGSYDSGTVSAAREAALEGISAIALSLDPKGHPDYAAAAQVALRVASEVKAHPLAHGVFLNVNVPAGPRQSFKGLRVTAQSEQTGVEKFVEPHHEDRTASAQQKQIASARQRLKEWNTRNLR